MLIIPSYIGLWLLQFFCILFPIVLYQSYFRKKYKIKHIQQWIFTILCALSIIICMTFPVSINQGYLLDFRFIPLIIAFLYGGYRCGLFLSVLLIVYRFIIGGIGFYLGGLWMTVFFVVVFYFSLPLVEKWSQKAREYYPYILLTFSLVFFALGTLILDDYSFTFSEIKLWLWFSSFNYLTFWMVLYLQNSLNETEIMYEKLIQFEKNHTINHLLVHISQQLIAPLQAANGHLQLLEKDTLSKQQSIYLLQTKNELIQAERYLEQYLTFMDTKWNVEKEVSFVLEIEEVIGLMKSYAEINQVDLLFTSTTQNDVTIKGDPKLLRFALLNIIKNGIEACSPKGRVNVCLHEMLKDVYLVIEDNGIGIPAKILEQLGNPLPSGKINGTGLGLASSFKITESMGGRVEVESQPNNGTVFSLYFPKWGFTSSHGS